MSTLRLALLGALLVTPLFSGRAQDRDLVTPATAEHKVLEAEKAPSVSVVHLWAPWCSNCQAEFKSGGWLKMVKANPQVEFYFVSIWNDGGDGKAMLEK